MKIKELLLKLADKYFEEFMSRGCAIEGHNGPHGHNDTPARNTAHWLIVYSYAYKCTGREDYLKLCIKFSDYIIELHNQSKSGAVICMKDDQYNHLNGLMGQAWIIEALVYFYKIVKDEKYFKAAYDIFNVQQYCSKEKMWQMIELDGTNIGFDFTFNHQLWFAAAGSDLLSCHEDPDLRCLLNDYLDGCMMNHFQVHHDGLIKHYGDLQSPYYRESIIRTIVKKYVKLLFFKEKRKLNPNKYDPDAFERGYQLFNLYAFAIIYSHLPEHPIFKDIKLKKAIEYGKKIEKHNNYFNVYNVLQGKSKEMNKYAYAYNSPAFEFPYVYKVFGINDLESICEKLMKIQMDLTYDNNAEMFSNNVSDSNTLTSRIYEVVRYLDIMDEEMEYE